MILFLHCPQNTFTYLPNLTFPLLKILLLLHKFEHLLCAEYCAKSISIQNIFVKGITAETTYFSEFMALYCLIHM